MKLVWFERHLIKEMPKKQKNKFPPLCAVQYTNLQKTTILNFLLTIGASLPEFHYCTNIIPLCVVCTCWIGLGNHTYCNRFVFIVKILVICHLHIVNFKGFLFCCSFQSVRNTFIPKLRILDSIEYVDTFLWCNVHSGHTVQTAPQSTACFYCWPIHETGSLVFPILQKRNQNRGTNVTQIWKDSMYRVVGMWPIVGPGGRDWCWQTFFIGCCLYALENLLFQERAHGTC